MSDIGFKYSILASGSSGNSFYLETPKKKILVDAGLSGKKITSLLSEINRKPEDLDAILITHEHSDHIHGVGVLARKYGMDLYANEKTWQAMENSKYLGKVDTSQKHIFERFYRADAARTRTDASGYGLGLAIAKTLADCCGYTIRIKSKPSAGAEFILVIPK